MGGSKEDTETCGHSSRTCARGLGDPLPVVSDGAPGVIRAIEECFPRSARQRCLAHRMRNLAVKVPTDLWSEFKAWAAACYQAPSRVIARELANGIRADYGAMLPSAISCFDTFGCRLPIAARRARQICLNVCSSRSRRRLKIIPNGFGEKPVLKLTFGALILRRNAGEVCASPSLSFARSPPSATTSMPNTMPKSSNQAGHHNRAFSSKSVP